MLRYMDRSTIHYLKQKGWTKTQIAGFVGHHRDTIPRILTEPVDQQPIVPRREPLAAVFAEQIAGWLDAGLSVRRMIDLACQHQLPGTMHPHLVLAEDRSSSSLSPTGR